MILFALLAAAGGALVFLAAFQFKQTTADNGIISVWSAAGAAFVCALTFWWLLIVRPNRLTWKRGALAGALTGLAAHPLAFLLAQAAWLIYGGYTQSEGLELVALMPALALAMSLWSWMLFGWVTVPLGAVTGGLLAGIFGRTRSAGHPEPVSNPWRTFGNRD
jgi:hypothetical protein